MPAEKACSADEKLPPGAPYPLWWPFTNDLDAMRAQICTDPVYDMALLLLSNDQPVMNMPHYFMNGCSPHHESSNGIRLVALPDLGFMGPQPFSCSPPTKASWDISVSDLA